MGLLVTDPAPAPSAGEQAAAAADQAASAKLPPPAPPEGQAAAPEIVGPAPDEKRFVVETVGSIKETLVNVAAMMAEIPTDEPELPRLRSLSPVSVVALEQGAALVAPHLRKMLAGGWWTIAAALAFDGLTTLRGLQRLRKKYHPDEEAEKDAKKPEGEAEERVPAGPKWEPAKPGGGPTRA